VEKAFQADDNVFDQGAVEVAVVQQHLAVVVA